MDIMHLRHMLHELIVNTLAPLSDIESDDIHRFRTSRFAPERPLHGVVTTHEPGGNLPDRYVILAVQMLARYSDRETEEAAEDMLDGIDTLLIPALTEAQDTPHWVMLDIVQSGRHSLSYDGSTYRISQHLIRLEV